MCHQRSSALTIIYSVHDKIGGVGCVVLRAKIRHNHSMSETAVLDKTDIDESTETDDEAPKHFHYVRKDKIAESAVMGNYVVALCGETFPVTKAPKPGSPVCPKCQEIYNKLRAE